MRQSKSLAQTHQRNGRSNQTESPRGAIVEALIQRQQISVLREFYSKPIDQGDIDNFK